MPDILVLAETKLDGSFPTSQFLINNYNEPTSLIVQSMVVVL